MLQQCLFLHLLRVPTIWLVAVSSLAVACGGTNTAAGPDAGPSADAGGLADAAPPVDLSEALFQPDHILEVNITLAPADWDVLRNQPDAIGMPKITCSNQPTEKPYSYFPGEITIDGATISNVGVRKKGGFGSITSLRPGFKIKANEYTAGQRISGLKRLTLNNNHQDSSLISQCLGYGLFRKAGVAAPRCSFAHVTVNGEDLGIYSNVESIKKDFLQRHFADNTGRLYESGGDFGPGETRGFQPKTNKLAPDCSDLDPVVAALQVADANLQAELGAVVNIDAFMTYWAMEVITDHWDGYANNRNNFFFYHDPTSDQLHFIPWGIDALFSGRARTTRPRSVFACGSLTWRMYDAPALRSLYLAKVRELLGTVWTEPAILTEIARMQALIEPIADPTGNDGLAGEIAKVRGFVSAQKATLLAELDAGTPVWPFAAGEDSCRIKIGSVAATFSTAWDTLDNFSAGTATVTGTVSGTSLTPSTGTSNAGLSDESKPLIQVFAKLEDGRFAVVFLIIQDQANLTPGTMAIDLVNVAAFMTFYDPVTDSTSGGGLMLGGSITLTSASAGSGDPVVGSLTGDVFEF